MAKLIIVESPEKGRTIQGFLGSGYQVIASKGHIRDLPKGKLAVDLENGFKPDYIEMPDKKTVIKTLKDAAKESDFVFLATDPDREGEAISWHLAKVLKLDEKAAIRVCFNEITRHGVKEGMEHPRTIDADLVDAQQTRRILDRIVGYKLSPFLWQKVKPGLSAGRVQSVVVRLVVEREREIRAFVPEEYWVIEALLSEKGAKFKAKFYGDKNGELKLSDKAAADKVIEACKNAPFAVTGVKLTKRTRRPAPPFTTSTLQQDASRRLGMRSERTMQIAQKLYEGINVEGIGETGLITYMRTDSLRVADEAAKAAEDYITSAYGKNYLPEKRNIYKAKNAQDAHEAIRPTTPELAPDKIKSSLTPEQHKLYKLIWERFMASQMAPCIQNLVAVELESAGYLFKANGVSVVFDGFTALYDNSNEEKEENAALLATLSEGDKPLCEDITGDQKFTQPPSRYNEASLIAVMEEKGIGRPSTYAPIISTILKREYVEREAKNFKPTLLGEAVTQLLEDKFPKIVDAGFTAGMEEQLDEIESGDMEMVPTLDKFYGEFSTTLTEAAESMKGQRIKLPDPESEEVCELCGRKMVIKTGRFGKFLACPGYPECKNTKPYQKKTDGTCPLCGKPLIERESKKGAKYYGCTGYPECKFMTWDEPIADKCPQCGTPMFRKKGKGAKTYCAKEGCGYEKAAYTKKAKEETE
ncbi:MAG TPA: type I DNA topoisomerase [Oscillospiraceae bacterium]|nr:type I DNA topoisomerase [Oscillospiraceae bacterium]HPF56192.1 type I DNA topoisomerase [Clostridiales bacterium]HPR76723.1 type I DNA topoisomerase [Oscillospiraceae bacterium]